MRLPFRNWPCWPWNQRDLAHLVGRPDCALVIVPLISWKGWEAMRGESLWLLLIWRISDARSHLSATGWCWRVVSRPRIMGRDRGFGTFVSMP
jgi:hypothetical protein